MSGAWVRVYCRACRGHRTHEDVRGELHCRSCVQREAESRRARERLELPHRPVRRSVSLALAAAALAGIAAPRVRMTRPGQ